MSAASTTSPSRMGVSISTRIVPGNVRKRRAEKRSLRLSKALPKSGIVTVTAETQFPGIFLDTHVPNYKDLMDR